MFENVPPPFRGPEPSLVCPSRLRWPNIPQFGVVSDYHLERMLLIGVLPKVASLKNEKEGVSVVLLGVAFRNQEGPSI